MFTARRLGDRIRNEKRAFGTALLVSLLVVAFNSVAACSDPCPMPRITYMGMCVSRCPSGGGLCTADGSVIPGTEDGGGPDVHADATGDVFDMAVERTCDAGAQACMGVCVDTSADPNHCGTCGRVCPGATGGRATCAAGVCGFACIGGFHQCGAACADDASPLSCGAMCMPCAAPAGASPTCAGGACGWACNPGYERVGGGCEVRVPRQVAPLSTATVTSQRPTLRWVPGIGTDGASIEICHDRAFTMGCQTVDITGTSGTVPTALTAGVWFWRLRGRIGGTVGARTSPIWEFFVGPRSASVNTSWGTVFDPNGDGFADAIVGAVAANGGSGRAYVYLGGRTGLGTTASLTLVPPVVDGSSWGFGASVASAGDVNGDGFADAVVGAPAANALAGRAYLFLGGASGLGATPAVELNPPTAGARTDFGISVASAGDINGDGYADVIVGADLAFGYDGRVYVYLGGAGGLSMTPNFELAPRPGEPSGQFGSSVTSAGDINGDGLGDVLVGAPYQDLVPQGRVHVFTGSAGGLVAASIELQGPVVGGSFDHFGTSVASANDINGDGYADAIVGSLDVGASLVRVRVFFGSPGGLSDAAALTISPPDADGSNAHFGYSVASAGDVNGDGFSEVIVGANGAFGGGRAHLYMGSASGLAVTPGVDLAPPSADGAAPSFGFSVAGIGDLNGDGYSDAIVGAISANGNAGRAHVYVGGPSGLGPTSAHDLVPPSTAGGAGQFGYSVSL